MTEGGWSEVRTKLHSTLGADAYSNWIEPLRLIKTDGKVAVFATPTKFIGNWVNRNYGGRICELMREAGSPIDRLEFSVESVSVANGAEPVHTSNGTGQNGKQVIEQKNGSSGKTELPTSALDKRLTFENFVVGQPNELAHAAARRVAESEEVSFNPLFLYGGVGLGKTHLMHAIAWEIQSNRPDAKVLYLSAEQFMHKFVQALRFKDMLNFKDLFRSVDVLMIDDVQFIAGKESTQDEFFHTFNALIDQNKQIVISADRSPNDIDDIDERIKSRLQWGLVVDIHPTDYELRLGILQSKAETNLQKYPGVVIENGVMEFLAHRISSNVRVLEGALTRLFAFATLVGKDVTLEMAQESLTDVLRTTQKNITVEEIIRKVADHYNLKVNDILSARRARAVARPRQIAMFLSKNLTSKSLPDIGRRFGGRDHTTVIHAIKKITELKETDAAIAEDVELLRRMIEG